MPVYEFCCHACGHKFEKLCRLGETGENMSCPSCGKKEIKKQFSLIQRPRGERGGASSGCSSCSSGNCGTCH